MLLSSAANDYKESLGPLGNVSHLWLTFRYLLALAIIAIISLLMFATITAELQRSQNDAFLINISGRQRMLSQRIALLALSVQESPGDTVQRKRLTDAVDLMRDSHATMLKLGDEDTASPMSDSLRRMYFGDAKDKAGVDAMVREYLLLADLVTGRDPIESSAFDVPAITPDDNVVHELTRMARQPEFLGELDAIVAQNELEAERHMKFFWKSELLFLLASLLSLVCVAWFIFRPMVKQIIQTLTSLKTANSELLQFAYRMSHDLRAPVVSSLGIVGLAQQSLEEGDVTETKTSLQHVERSLRKVSSTTEDILQLLQTRMSNVKPESLELDALVRESMASVSNLPGAESVDLQIKVDVNHPIQAKRIYIQQTLENLLSNAIKYRDPDREQSFVRVVATARDGICRIDVSDNGLGIDAAYHEKVFSMFQRFHTRVAFGTGLGLYLVQQNAMALEGQIQYVPQTDGSLFRLTFPCQ